jgi:hypothetical protein
MRWPILLALAVTTMPTAAHAQRSMEETIGAWKLTGTGGDCMISVRSGKGLVAIASPATGGENHGGMIISADGVEVQNSDRATLTFTGSGAFAGEHPLTPYSDISGYWRSFPSPRAIDGFPDRWRVMVERDDVTIMDVSVTDFTRARAALWRCVDATK